MCHLLPRMQIMMLTPHQRDGGKHRKYALSAYINDFDAHCFCGEEQVAVMGDQRKIPVDLHFLYCRHKAGGASNQQTVWWNFAVSDSSLG